MALNTSRHQSDDPYDVDDLTQLESLDEESLLLALKTRYKHGKIYTYIGDVLVALNPYRNLHIYDLKYNRQYKGLQRRDHLAPHIYWVANKAYSRMRQSGASQTILLSGESGAGKTQSTGLLIEHMAFICGEKRDEHSLDKIIIKVNPLLEAFGNAKTTLNDNSSRFGKYIELHFAESGLLQGAEIHDYMLEKSRVVRQGFGDKNFHIFYYLMAGMSEDELNAYGLSEQLTYRILHQDRSTLYSSEEERLKFVTKYKQLVSITEEIGFSNEEMTFTWSLVAAILNLTNIRFEERNDTTGGVVIANGYELEQACSLLDVERQAMEKALTVDVLPDNARGFGEVVRVKNYEQACYGRDSLAKALYNGLFSWLVSQINRHMRPRTTVRTSDNTIGILDMSGFENFTSPDQGQYGSINSFEQLLINLANEHLQHFFNEHIFSQDQHEIEQGGINWHKIRYNNNDSILKLFEGSHFDKKPGILDIIDDECRTPQSSDVILVRRCHAVHGDTPHYSRVSRGDAPIFRVTHFAGNVTYNAEGFLEKNRDPLSPDLASLIKSSKIPAVASLLRDVLPRNAAGGRTKRTVSQSFRASLRHLITKLSEAQPLFIRCLKPNPDKHPGSFDEDYVRNQMKYNGLLELTKIKKIGFPVRLLKEKFVDRYRVVLSGQTEAVDLDATISEIFDEVNIKDAETGYEKVFLKEWHRDLLEERVKKVNKAASLIQTRWRGYVTRKKFQTVVLKKIEETKRKRLAEKLNTGSKMAGKQSSFKSSSSESSQKDPDYETIPGYKIKDGPSLMPNPAADGRTMEDAGQDVNDTPPEPTGGEEDEEDEKMRRLREEEEQERLQDELAEDTLPSGQWDVFRLIPRERISSAESFSGLLKVLKVVVCLVLFIGFLACLIIHKGSLVFMTSAIATEMKSEDFHTMVMYMLICMSLPHGITFIIYVFKGLFGSQPWPGLTSLILLLFLETIHAFSSCALLFLVLPQMDMIRALCIMELVAFLPGLFKLFLCAGPCFLEDPAEADTSSTPTSSGKTSSSEKKPRISKRVQIGFYYALNAVALLGQLAGLVLLGWFGFRLPTLGGAGDQETPYYHWLFPVCLLCKSVTWWENFVDVDLTCGRLNLVPLRKWKVLMHRLRQKATIFTSLWNVGVVFTFPLIASYAGVPRFDKFEYRISSAAQPFSNELVDPAPLIANGLSAFVGFHLGSLACKLLMQRISFNLPLLLSTPLTIGALMLQCRYHFIPTSDQQTFEWHCPDRFENTDIWQLTCCGIFWLSMLIIACYLWRPRHNPMDRNEKLFIRPLYDPVFFSQHMMLNRRRRDNEVRHNDFTNQIYFPENDDVTYASSSVLSSSSKGCQAKVKEYPPMIYACATMWHETKNEMTQLLKSVFRMDKDQCTRRNVRSVDKHFHDPDYYEYETHILFDDAFEQKDNQTVPNEYVRQLYDVIDEAASSVHAACIRLDDPTKMTTPYGGRLTWTLPGGTKLIVHLKDKNKIRHKKRWSQCMYMYYLLGYRLIGKHEDTTLGRKTKDKRGRKRAEAQFLPHNLFSYLPECVHKKAQNTFVLALDGDVDFKPEAVRLLVDQMKANPKVASACGRIHPIGDGPVVWFQQFEYAIGHWLQKAAEHVFGCVLCSPGCFSLFRASALMDDNVMRRYCELAEAPREVVQFDQGEDRWLCTLLLQQGYRVTYCAAADALTYAPETFNEFYNQRRRWMPSTMANIMDLLSSFKHTIRVNDNMSYLYMFYQFILFFASILGPGTVIMMLAGSFNTVLGTNLLHSYLLAIEPVAFFVLVCFTTRPNSHVLVAQFLSAIYSTVMMVVIIGTIINAITESWSSPNVIFLVTLIFFFVIAALVHPQEFVCLLPGILYFLTFPSAYLLLPLYSLCNLNVVSWGTREKPQAKTKEEIEREKKEQEEKLKKKKEGSGLLKWLGLSKFLHDVKEYYNVMVGRKISQDDDPLVALSKRLDELEKNNNDVHSSDRPRPKPNQLREMLSKNQTQTSKPAKETSKAEKKPVKTDALDKDKRADSKQPCWIDTDIFSLGRVEELSEKESAFWRLLIRIHLHPILKDKEKEKNMEEALKSLRTNIVFGFLMLNFLWIVIVFQLQLLSETLKDSFFVPIPRADNPDEKLLLEPLGFAFLIVFGVVLTLQFIGMLLHRWDTFCHIIARTEIRHSRDSIAGKLKTAEILQSFGHEADVELEIPAPDYDDEPEADYGDDDDDGERRDDASNRDSGLDRTASFSSSVEANSSSRPRQRPTKDGGRSAQVAPPPVLGDSYPPVPGQRRPKYDGRRATRYGEPPMSGAYPSRRYLRQQTPIGQVNVAGLSLHKNFQRRYNQLIKKIPLEAGDRRRPTFDDLYRTIRRRSERARDYSPYRPPTNAFRPSQYRAFV